jgi:uncharacterized protein YecE (DUF72 family)
MQAGGQVYIGTSGWSYKGWDKTFYPKEVRKAEQFEFYATQFPTVEINNTFYRLPTISAARAWAKKAPPGFVYAVKGSRFITHMKKIANLDGALKKFFDRIRPLQKRTGVLLWQLPPFLKKDQPRLDHFLKLLPRTYCHAVEFRHASWIDDEIFATLRRHHAAHASVSSLGMPMNLTVTARIVYIRFHGLQLAAAHDYTRAELRPWAAHIREQVGCGRTVFVYFNNDLNVRAPANAKMLMEMVGACAAQPFAQAA